MTKLIERESGTAPSLKNCKSRFDPIFCYGAIMSRSGYVDDMDDALALGRWRAQVKSAIRGKRGQAFLRDMAAAMDAMPDKILISGDLIDQDGDCCAIGSVCKVRGLDVSKTDVTDPKDVGELVGIAHQLAAEIEYENDECGERYEKIAGTHKWQRIEETPEERWQRMRKWVESQIIQST